MIHLLEAKGLELLWKNDKAIRKLNVLVGAFGQGVQCYASFNGALGGALPSSLAIGLWSFTLTLTLLLAAY